MKLSSLLLACVALSSVSVIAVGCAAGDPDDEDVVEAGGVEKTETFAPIHMMPLTTANHEALAAAIPANAHLNYYGGPVIQKVNVIPVFWTSTVANQTQLNNFYKGVTNSPHFDQLAEYNTASPAQTFSRGTAQNGYVDNASTTKITEAKIQAELTRLFNNNLIPKPTANNFYAVHFPKNVGITASDGSKACVQFCAFHSTYVYNGQNVYYSVMPDVSSSGCAGGCGASTAFNNETSVASHELIEAVTDAAVGLATTYAPPLAWYDPNNGEIGDICNGLQGTVVGGDGVTYTVQKEWSNARGGCFAQ